jgi:hypothetical protein
MVAAVAAGVLAAGCQFDWTDKDPTQGPAAAEGLTARGRLVRAHTLDVTPTDSTLRVNGTRLPLTWGRTRMLATAAGELRLENLDLMLGSVEIRPSTLPPSGLSLRNVRVSLAKADRGTPEQNPSAHIEWSTSGDAGFATLPVDLALDWNFVTASGDIEPLTTQRIDAVKLDVTVWSDPDGRLHAVLTGRLDGIFWEWLSGQVQMRDLIVDLKSDETVVPN